MDEQTQLLREMRDLLRVIAEPQLAARDKRLRSALLEVVGESTRRANAVLLMDGSRSQAELYKESGMDLSALETIESISNRKVVEDYVIGQLKTDKAIPIMKECEERRTREYLISKFQFKSGPALDHHLKPLRDADLIQQRFDDDGDLSYEWSNLFRRLPKSTIKHLLQKPN